MSYYLVSLIKFLKMRKLLFLALILASTLTFSQSPQKINYQAIARDGSGNIVTTLIGIKFEIIQGSPGGTVVYNETNTSMPSTAGIFNTHIGSGTPGMGPFTSINWANSPHFIRVSIDPAGGTSYNVVGTSELVSVPYALYAETAGNTQSLTPGNGITINSGTITNSAPNQTVNISGSAVTGSYPNYTITSPGAPTASTGISISGGTITNTAPDQTITISGATGTYPNFTITPQPSTTITPGNSNITVSGSDPNFTISAVPQLTVVGNQLSISNGNTVTLPTGTTYTNGAGIALTSGTIITNTAPNQTVNIANGTNVTVNSAYPNFTINATPTLSLATNVLSISGGNSVALPTSPATTVTAGNNMNVAGAAPTYTVSTPTYSLNFPNSSIVNVTNGINTTTASIPQPTLTLSGPNNNVISAGSNSITIPRYIAGNGLVLTGASPNFTLGATSTGTAAAWNNLGNTGTNAGVNFLGTTDAQDLVFRTNNNQRARIFSNGNFGIGNMAGATELLQVESGSITAASIISGTTSTLFFGNSGNHYLGAVRYDNTNNSMSFWTNNTADRIFINSFGDVGVGTTSPSQKFHVYNGSAIIETNPGQNSILLDQGSVVTNEQTGGTPRFVNAINGIWQWGAGITNTGNNDYHIINYPGSRFDFNILGANGFVGIGIQNPIYKLSVESPAFNIADFKSTAASDNRISISGTSGTWGSVGYALFNNSFQLSSYGNNDVCFGTNNLASINMMLKTNGNVGIGVLNPGGKLEVAGNIVVPSGNNYRYAAAKTKYMKVGAAEMLSANSAIYSARIDDGFSSGTINGLNSLWAQGGAAGNPAFFIAPVHLPDSAVITAFTAQVVKNGGSLQSVVELWRSDGSGYLANAAQLISSCTTSFSGGAVQYISAGTVNVSYQVVNNQNYIYFIRYSGEQNTQNLRFHLATITYQIYRSEQ